MDVLRQLVEDVPGEIPEEVVFSLKRSDSVVEGILAEARWQIGRTTMPVRRRATKEV